MVALEGTGLRLVLRDVIIQDNLAGYRGGWISLRTYGDASLSVEIRDVIIPRNRSPGYGDGRQGRGGGAWVHAYGGQSHRPRRGEPPHLRQRGQLDRRGIRVRCR